ncbi:MAG TPA: peptide ABC transporter substrate-binding protein [Azospirillaceae bacterium]|nr:peptide ABC transporter substrate-binding protein [Azospirillaceae bacterium]
MRKLLRTLLLAATVPLAAAPTAAAQAQTGAQTGGHKGTLTVGITNMSAALHPGFDPTVAQAFVLAMARRPVTGWSHDLTLVCRLCEQVPTLENGLAKAVTRADGSRGIDVTYRLREGLAWGDGTPVTSADVVFGWEVGRHPLSGYAQGSLYTEEIAGITAVDARTFTVHRRRAACDYADISRLHLLPAHVERPVFERQPAEYRNRSTYVTNPANPALWFGPYRVAEVQPGASLLLERNPAWTGPRPHFDRIAVRIFDNRQALEANLLSGAVDYVAGEQGFNVQQAKTLGERNPGRFRVEWTQGNSFNALFVNLDDPVLGDARVRRALLMAVDRPAIIRRVLYGRAVPRHNWVSPLEPHFDPAAGEVPFDPAAAGRLLDEAGWAKGEDGMRRNASGERLTVELDWPAVGDDLVQQVMMDGWRKLGVETRGRSTAPRAYFSDVVPKRSFGGLAYLAWFPEPRQVPAPSLRSTMVPGPDNNFTGQNFSGYRSAAMDGWLDKAATQCGARENRAAWSGLQRQFAADLPVLPLWSRQIPFVLPLWLEGVNPTAHTATSNWIEEWRRRE